MTSLASDEGRKGERQAGKCKERHKNADAVIGANPAAEEQAKQNAESTNRAEKDGTKVGDRQGIEGLCCQRRFPTPAGQEAQQQEKECDTSKQAQAGIEVLIV